MARSRVHDDAARPSGRASTVGSGSVPGPVLVPGPVPGPEVIWIERVAAGASAARLSRTLPLSALREFCARVIEERGARHLPDDRPPEPGQCFDLHAAGMAIALRGGESTHLRYSLPMLSALDLPLHLFLSLARLGAPEGWTLDDLATWVQDDNICFELDLGETPPTRSREFDEHLSRAGRLFEEHAGASPRYVWVPGPPRDRRLGLVLKRHGFTGAVSHGFAHHHIHEGLWMWTARRAGWRAIGTRWLR